MQAENVHHQLSKYMKKFGVNTSQTAKMLGGDVDSIKRCLTSGYFVNAAMSNGDGTYTSIREGMVSNGQIPLNISSFFIVSLFVTKQTTKRLLI